MTISANARAALARRMRREISGDCLFDDFSRGRYATDASAFQSFPLGIVIPKTQDDLAASIRLAWEGGIPLVARGGGTGLSGQTLSEGLVIDLSKYLTRLLYYDPNARTCIVEPGITVAKLNAALQSERVVFPVDIASSEQATIGGMVGTDAIGRRALSFGRMRDNVVALDAYLADGQEISFGEITGDVKAEPQQGSAYSHILDLLEMAESHEKLIRSLPSFPAVKHAYNLHALLGGETPQNLAAFLTGSEGTLAIAKRVELKLAPRYRSNVLGICHFPSLASALKGVSAIMALSPVSVELTDRRIIDLGITASTNDSIRRIMRKDGAMLLFVEFMGGNRVANARKLKELADQMERLGHVRAVSEIIGSAAQQAIRDVRASGLTRLYANTPGNPGVAPLEEFAVPLKALAASAESINELLLRYGMDVIWYGMAGIGALHLRPWLRGGKPASDAKQIAAEASAILHGFAGSLVSSLGHGLARSHLLEKQRDPAITELFEQIKTLFDPKNRLNPGKIVFSPEPSDMFWRSMPPPEVTSGLSALACDGNGLCRKLTGVAMCPSFRLTQDERDSPRGRANTLRLALAGSLGEEALISYDMTDTMRLCVSCKACRTQCPRSVDIARAKIAVQIAQRDKSSLTKFEQSAAFLPHYASKLRPWRHLLNLRDFLPWMGQLSEKFTGISADRPWPYLAANSFADDREIGPQDGQEALLFVDTFNNNFDKVTLRATADVLAASGFRIRPLLAPKGETPYCCGRTFLETGMIDHARKEARRLIAATAPFIARGVPLIGVEPSCMLTIRDEFVNLLKEEGAKELAAKAKLFEEVMALPVVRKKLQPHLREIEAETLHFSHCHQNAFSTAELAKQAIELVPGISVIETEKTCCGMGTCFGYAPDTVTASLQMGEQSLFPEIRKRGRNTLIIGDGFACRKQIKDGTGRTARHTAVLLKLALAAKEKFGAKPDNDTEIDDALAKRVLRLRRYYFK